MHGMLVEVGKQSTPEVALATVASRIEAGVQASPRNSLWLTEDRTVARSEVRPRGRRQWEDVSASLEA